MERVIAFVSTNRNELLMTALIMLGIQFVTSAGGYIERKKNMRRLDDPPPDSTPSGGST